VLAEPVYAVVYSLADSVPVGGQLGVGKLACPIGPRPAGDRLGAVEQLAHAGVQDTCGISDTAHVALCGCLGQHGHSVFADEFGLS
jgi:hypothetical protein